jgi:hypothetical protein
MRRLVAVGLVVIVVSALLAMNGCGKPEVVKPFARSVEGSKEKKATGSLVVQLEPPAQYGLFKVLGKPGSAHQSGETVELEVGSYTVNPDPSSLETNGAGSCWSVEVKANQTSFYHFKVGDLLRVNNENAEAEAARAQAQAKPKVLVPQRGSISQGEAKRFLTDWFELCEQGKNDQAASQLHSAQDLYGPRSMVPRIVGDDIQGKEWSLYYKKSNTDKQLGPQVIFGAIVGGKDIHQDIVVLRDEGKLRLAIVPEGYAG